MDPVPSTGRLPQDPDPEQALCGLEFRSRVVSVEHLCHEALGLMELLEVVSAVEPELDVQRGRP